MSESAVPALTPGPVTRPWTWLLGLAALTVLVYARAMAGQFLFWDDTGMVVNNADLRLGSWPAIARYWSPANPHEGLYAPLTYTLYFWLARIADATHGSLHPLPFHLAGLATHLAAGLCVWALLRRLLVDPRAALAGVAIFWLHPIQVEPVAWIGSLNTVLSGAFVLAALSLYARAATAPTRRGRAIAATFALVALALAAFAKPAAAGAPLAALAIDRWALGSRWRAIAWRIAPWIAMSVLTVLAARYAQSPGLVVPPGPVGRAIVAVDTVGFYLGRVVAPVNLTIDYGRTPERVLGWGPFTVACVGLAIAASIAVLLIARRRPVALAAAGLFVAGILPVLGLVPFQFQYYSTVADRYLYWSMAGVALGVAAIVSRRPARGRFDRPVAVVVIGAMAVASFLQTAHWADDDALFERSLALNPASRSVLKGYAERSMRMSERTADMKVLADLYADAAARYRAGIAFRPEDGVLHDGLATLAWAAGDYVTADREYAVATEMNAPPDWAGHNRWGIALNALGREEEAIAKLEAAARLNPWSSDTRTNLAAILLKRGRRDEARALVDRALELNPKSARAAELKRTLRP